MLDPFMPIDLKQITTGHAGSEARRAKNSSDNSLADGKPGSVNNNIAQQDSVELSDKAQQVKSLLSDISSMPEVNQSRVEQLRNAIASGNFSVSADKIAGKMLALENGLRKLS